MSDLPGSGAPPPLARRAAWAVVVGMAGFATGVLLGVVGDVLHPLVVAALPVLGVVAWYGIADARVALGLVVASLPVGTLSVPIIGLDVIEVAILAAVGLLGLGQLLRGRPPLGWAAPMAWAVVLLCLALAATPRAVDPAAAIRIDLQLAAGILLAMAVIAAAATPRTLETVVMALVVVGGGIAGAAAAGAGQATARLGGAVVQGRAQGVFAQPNELGMFAVMIGAVGLAIAVAGRTPRMRRTASICAAAAGAALLASLSRGAWAGAVVAVAVLAVQLPQSRRRIVATGLIVASAALVLSVVAPDQPQITVVRQRLESLTSGAENPHDARSAIYAEAVRQISSRPGLGWGPGSYPIVAGAVPSGAAGARPAHAHNLLLNVAAEAGLVAAAAVVALGGAIVLRVRASGRGSGGAVDPLAVGALAAVAGVAGQGLVDYPLQNPVLSAVLWLLVGVAAAAPSGQPASNSRWDVAQASAVVDVPHSAGVPPSSR